jgi:hypothetical protein
MRKASTSLVGTWKRTALRIGAFLVAGAVSAVGVTLLVPEDAERCLAWRERPIEETRMTLSALRTLRAGTPVHEAPGFLSAGLFLPPGFGGVALPDRIIVSSRLRAERRLSDREYIVWHEIVHVEQMHQEGVPRFAFVYAADWIRGRWSGCGSFSSYEAIRYEREAARYAVAMGVAEWARLTTPGTRQARQKPKDDGHTHERSIARVMDIAIDEGVELARIVDELLEMGF